MVYDITDPAAPTFVEYFSNRHRATNSGDLGPENGTFIGDDPPTGKPLIAVAHEVSGSMTLYNLR